jgi:Fungal specific transcription factor domain
MSANNPHGVLGTAPSSCVSVPFSLPMATDHLALCYFITEYIIPDAGECSPGHLDCLPELYQESRQPCFRLAMLAAANMAAFNRWGSATFWTESRRQYGLSLTALRSAMNSDENALTDDILTAALLLHMFVVSSMGSQSTLSHNTD